MGRDKDHPLTQELYENSADLLARVNWVMGRLNVDAKVTSGYRPSEINQAIGGAKNSAHQTCQAIDLHDPFGKIGTLLLARLAILIEAGLYLESPSYTIRTKNGVIEKWIHLQSRETKARVFIP